MLFWMLVSAAAAAEPFQGQPIQGGLIVGRAAPDARVLLDGEPLKLAPDGRFVFGFGRDRTGTARIEIFHPDGTQQRYDLAIEERDYDIQRIDGLPPRTVTIPEAEQKRRAKERAQVAQARQPVTDALDWQGGFIWPAKGRISGVYGSQRILNGKPRWPHYGVDLAAPTGTPVVAPAGGLVRLADPDFLLEGGIVILDHGHGVTSTLFHLNSVEVAVGERVAQGQRIGTVGATGRATGPHLDWRINWKSVRLDPQLVAGPLPE